MSGVKILAAIGMPSPRYLYEKQARILFVDSGLSFEEVCAICGDVLAEAIADGLEVSRRGTLHPQSDA